MSDTMKAADLDWVACDLPWSEKAYKATSGHRRCVWKSKGGYWVAEFGGIFAEKRYASARAAIKDMNATNNYLTNTKRWRAA